MTNDSNDDVKPPKEEEIELFLTAAYRILEMIKNRLPDGKLPVKEVTKKIIRDSKVVEVVKADLDQFFYRDLDDEWRQEYFKLESLSDYIKYMIDSGEIDFNFIVSDSAIFEGMDPDKKVKHLLYFTESFVLYPVIDCIISSFSVKLGRRQLIDSYIKYTSSWKCNYIVKKYYTPLVGFGSETHRFEFNNEFSVIQFTDEVKTKIHESTYHEFTNNYTSSEICESTHLIHWERRFLRTERPFRNDHASDLYLLIMCLRICNASDVVAKFSFHELRERISIIGNGGYWHFETSKPYQFYKSHSFSLDNLNSAKGMFNTLLELKSKNGFKSIFNVVVNRYLSSLSRTTSEDSVIDFTICLESLLLFGMKDELKFRLSLRGAVLLKNRIPSDTKRLLQQMYDDRSKIVHEGKSLSELTVGRENQAKNCLENYRLVTEEIIATYIAESGNFSSIDAVNQYLDNLCVKAAQLQSSPSTSDR